MALGGFLQQLGQQAGNNILMGQEIAGKQADIDYKQNLVAQQKQQMQSAKDMGSFLKQAGLQDAATVNDPAKAAAAYNRASDLAAQAGDFDGAAKMTALAKGKLDEVKSAAEVVQKKQATAKEALATSAEEFATNPTKEGQDALVKSAIDAGVNPATIPVPGTARWGAWVKEQQMAGMSSKDRVEFVQKTAETAQKMEETRQAHRDHEQDVANARADRAMIQAGMRQDRQERERDRQEARAARAPVFHEFSDGTYQYDPTGKMPGDRKQGDPAFVKVDEVKMTAAQKTGVSKLNASVSEGSRTLKNFGNMDFNATTSPFKDAHENTLLGALTKTGANQLSTQQMQFLNSAGAGLGNQIGLAESAFGGRGPVGSQQQHLEASVTPAPGDTGYTAGFKLANAKEMLLTEIDNAPAAYRNSADAQKRRDELNAAVPWSTSDMIKAAKTAGAKKDVASMHDWAEVRAARVQESASVDKDGGAAAPTAPVTPPPAIQDLVERYRTKK